MMRVLTLGLIWLLGVGLAPAQLYVGPNFGPAYGPTADLQLYFYPHSEDWIALSLSGGYSFNTRVYFPRKEKDCLEDLRSGGWHIRAGARGDLSTLNHSSHLYWELLAVYTRQNESATIGTCSADLPTLNFAQDYHMLSGALRLGYTWDPMERKTINPRVLFDFGIQLGLPIWSSQPRLGERNHFSGIGMTRFPIRTLAWEPTIIFRYKAGTRRYGYHKGREKKLFERKDGHSKRRGRGS